MTNSNENSQKMESLITHDVDPLRAARIQRLAEEAFDLAHAPNGRNDLTSTLWDSYRAIEPIGLGIIGVAYLVWAMQAVMNLHS
jgi:hypothetical protein